MYIKAGPKKHPALDGDSHDFGDILEYLVISSSFFPGNLQRLGSNGKKQLHSEKVVFLWEAHGTFSESFLIEGFGYPALGVAPGQRVACHIPRCVRTCRACRVPGPPMGLCHF